MVAALIALLGAAEPNRFRAIALQITIVAGSEGCKQDRLQPGCRTARQRLLPSRAPRRTGAVAVATEARMGGASPSLVKLPPWRYSADRMDLTLRRATSADIP